MDKDAGFAPSSGSESSGYDEDDDGQLDADAADESPAWWELDYSDETPAKVRRKCTDTHWCVWFLLLVAGVIVCMARFCTHRQGLRYILHFADANGKLCEPGYLFFCLLQPDLVDIRNPVCLPFCPNASTVIVRECAALPGEQLPQAGYATRPFGYQLCRPTKGSVVDQLLSHWVDIAQGRWAFAVIVQHRSTFLSTIVFSIFSSYTMMFLLAKHAGLLIRAGIWMMGWLPFLGGIWETGVLRLVPVVRDFIEMVPQPARTRLNLLQGSALVVFGLVFIGIGRVMERSVKAAVRCIEMTYTCAVQSQMVHHPLAMLFWLIAISAVLCWGTAVMMVARQIESDTLKERLLIGLFVFCWAWGSQALFVYSEFISIFTTATWCMQGGFRQAGYVSARDICLAHWNVWRYHIGSCVFGGLLIGLVRPIQLTVGGLIHFIALRGNPLRACAVATFGSCLSAFDERIGAINKNGFNEVVFSGLPFLEAAEKTQTNLQRHKSSRGARSILNGATVIIQMCCIFANAGVGAAFVWFNTKKSESAKESLLVLTTGMLVGGSVTLPFVLFVDSMSDTILYSSEILQERGKRRISAMVHNSRYSYPCMRWKGPKDDCSIS